MKQIRNNKYRIFMILFIILLIIKISYCQDETFFIYFTIPTTTTTATTDITTIYNTITKNNNVTQISTKTNTLKTTIINTDIITFPITETKTTTTTINEINTITEPTTVIQTNTLIMPTTITELNTIITTDITISSTTTTETITSITTNNIIVTSTITTPTTFIATTTETFTIISTPTQQFCEIGCFEYNHNNDISLIAQVSGNVPYTYQECSDFCEVASGREAIYYSLFESLYTNPHSYTCICYKSPYIQNPLNTNDPPCGLTQDYANDGNKYIYGNLSFIGDSGYISEYVLMQC
jgi:hypothetical protein